MSHRVCYHNGRVSLAEASVICFINESTVHPDSMKCRVRIDFSDRDCRHSSHQSEVIGSVDSNMKISLSYEESIADSCFDHGLPFLPKCSARSVVRLAGEVIGESELKITSLERGVYEPQDPFSLSTPWTYTVIARNLSEKRGIASPLDGTSLDTPVAFSIPSNTTPAQRQVIRERCLAEGPLKARDWANEFCWLRGFSSHRIVSTVTACSEPAPSISYYNYSFNAYCTP